MKETLKKAGKPFKQLIYSPLGFQLLSLSILLIFVLSFRPNHFQHNQQSFGSTFGEESADFLPITEEGFLDSHYGVSTAGSREIIIVDEDGNETIKIQPKKREKSLTYKVKSGENVSKIAHKFGLNVSTINWANNITSKSTLQVGQELKIPPTNGIYYSVESGDTLGEIAKIHDIDIKKIYAYNTIKSGGNVSTNQEIFIPDAKKVYIIRELLINTKTGSQKKSVYKNIPEFSRGNTGKTIASMGTKIQRPTKGILTQGYHKGHYALDIASKMNTPIYAAAGGTVITSSDGWNYGYGNYIIIDHGNGIETLYGHNNVRKVSVGDTVKRGQLIALMGNSGRVFGVTGIHLHFELRINGRKVNPGNYF